MKSLLPKNPRPFIKSLSQALSRLSPRSSQSQSPPKFAGHIIPRRAGKSITSTAFAVTAHQMTVDRELADISEHVSKQLPDIIDVDLSVKTELRRVPEFATLQLSIAVTATHSVFATERQWVWRGMLDDIESPNVTLTDVFEDMDLSALYHQFNDAERILRLYAELSPDE